MIRGSLAILITLLVVFSPQNAPAQQQFQTKQQFVDALIQFLTAVSGTFGDEGPQLLASVAGMEEGLRRWDLALGAYERSIRTQLAGSPASVAAGMQIALGAVYLERGRFDAAQREFAAAAAADLMRADVHVFRAIAFDLVGANLEAADAFRDAWLRDPDAAANAYSYLRHAIDLGRPDDVSKALHTLTEFLVRREADPGNGRAAPFIRVSLLEEQQPADPTFPPAQYAAAFAALSRGHYEQAVAEFRGAAARDPLNVDSARDLDSMTKGAVALRAGDITEAIRQLTASSESVATSSEAHRLLGTAYWLKGEHDRSIVQFETAIRLRPEDERSRIELSEVLVGARQIERAAQVLRDAVAAIPNSGKAQWRLGGLYQLLHRDDQARTEFERALTIMPIGGAAQAYATVSRLALGQADIDATIVWGRRRVAVDPNDLEAHNELGSACRRKNLDVEALAEFLMAALIDPRNAEAYAGIGQVHLAAGRYTDAIGALKRAVTVNPSWAETRYALANALIRAGRDAEGQAELATAQRLQTQHMEAVRRGYELNLLKIEAALRTEEGKPEAAAALWRDVAKQEPGVAANYVALGQALANASHHDAAIEAFVSALKLTPDPEVHRLLADEYARLQRSDDSDRERAEYQRMKHERLAVSLSLQ